MYRKTYIEIDTKALEHNVQTIIATYPQYKTYIGVVKGNAYGHGLMVAKHLVSAGINYLAVDKLEDGIALREQGIKTPILCLQPIEISHIQTAVSSNITITLSHFQYFKDLMTHSFDGVCKVHLKIDSGFNRFGVSRKEEVTEIYKTLITNSKFILKGLYTHFAGASSRESQLQMFNELVSDIDIQTIPIIHMDRSFTLQRAGEGISLCTGVRIGSLMYGYESLKKQSFLERLFKKPHSTISRYKPAFSLYSHIIETKPVQAGQGLGYGWHARIPSHGYISMIPIGYADGFLKKNEGGVVYIGEKPHIILSVDMGVTTIFSTESFTLGERVELIGEHIPLRAFAQRNEDNIYGTLCMYKETIPRILK